MWTRGRATQQRQKYAFCVVSTRTLYPAHRRRQKCIVRDQLTDNSAPETRPAEQSDDVEELEEEVDFEEVDDSEELFEYVASEQTPQPGSQWSNQMGLWVYVGLAFVAGAAIYSFVIRSKRSKMGAPEDSPPEVGGIGNFFGQVDASIRQDRETRQLQKEAQVRLQRLMGQLANNQSANLSAQNLGDEGLQHVSSALQFNTTLRALDLSRNGITPAGIAASLQALASAQVLETLALDTNSLADEGAAYTATIVQASRSLQKLDLSSNAIGDEGAKALATRLSPGGGVDASAPGSQGDAGGGAVPPLVALHLNSNSVDLEGATALAAMLRGNHTLQELSLNDNYVAPQGALELAAALRVNRGITSLHLRQNDLQTEGVTAVCQALQERETECVVLDVSSNNAGPEAAEAVGELVKAKELRELRLYAAGLGDGGCRVLAEALKQNKSIRVLDLGGNELSAMGVGYLLEAVKNHPTLENLQLGQNPIGITGAQLVASAAKYDMPQLATLKLNWCHLGPEGARHVGQLLMYNSTLQQVDLRGNAFGEQGCRDLATALRQMHDNTNLMELDLAYNELNDDAACMLANALKTNPERAVRVLKVNNNYLTGFGQVALSEAVDLVYELASRETSVVF